MTKKELIFLIGIFIVAFCIRFIGQPKYPSCLHRDEIQFGYNAYSIIKTGRDEWGKLLPLHFKFNGEYHVPMVFYLIAGALAFTGPIDIAIRLPAIILGSFIPILGYLLVRRLTDNKKISFFTACLLTINPWQVINSRGSGEISIISLFFGVFGFYLLFTFLKTKKVNIFLLSLLSFIATYFSYIASRLDIPLLLTAFLIVFYKKIPFKKFTVPFIAFVIFLPFILVAAYPKRFVATSVIAKHFFPEEPERQTYVRSFYESNRIKFFVTQSRAVAFEFLDNYFDYISPYYIFRNLGEPDRTNINETGSLYLVEIISVAFGIYALFASTNKDLKKFLSLWLLLAPLAGALTYNSPDRPNTARSVYFYFGLSILSAYGLAFLYAFFSKRRLKFAVLGAITLFLGTNALFFERQLTIYSEEKLSSVRSCGYKELFTKTESLKDKYDSIYIGKLYDYPYIQFLWYTKYPPQKYHEFLKSQPENVPVLIHTKEKNDWQLENYVYAHDACPTIQKKGVLLVGNYEECKNTKQAKILKDKNSDRLLFSFPKTELIFKHIDSIVRSDGKSAFDLYTYDPDIDTKLTEKSHENFISLF